MGIREQFAAELRNSVSERLAERQAEHAAYPGKALLWAAVGPVWTASVARLAGFPTGGRDIATLLDEIAAGGFTARVAASPQLQRDATTGKPILTAGEDLYAAGEQAVREIIETTTDVSQREQNVRSCIANICQGLRGAQQQGNELPGRIVKWLELAGHLRHCAVHQGLSCSRAWTNAWRKATRQARWRGWRRHSRWKRRSPETSHWP